MALAKINNLASTQDLQENIANDLGVISSFHKLLNSFNNSDDVRKLIQSASELVSFDTDSLRAINLEEQIIPTQIVTLLINKLANKDEEETIQLINYDKRNSSLINFKHLAGAEFRFYDANLEAGGYYLFEENFRLPMLYIDLENKRFFIHAENFVKFGRHVQKQNTLFDLLRFEENIKQIADDLEKADFITDLNVFNHINILSQSEISAEIFDKLLINVASESIKLREEPSGIQISFDEQVTLTLEKSETPANVFTHWKFEVDQTNKKHSLLTLLYQYENLRDWYLENIDQLGVKYHYEVFD